MRKLISSVILSGALVAGSGCAVVDQATTDQALTQQQSALRYLQVSESALDATLHILQAGGVQIPEPVSTAMDAYKIGVADYGEAIKDCAATPEVERRWTVARAALTTAADLVAALRQ